MKVKFYGTRGSVPISSPRVSRYGGNTTCLRVDSPCLPEGTWLVVDAGTGIVPLSWDFTAEKGRGVILLLSHYHHDHTGGLMLTGFPYDKRMPLDIFGPRDHGIGPAQVYRALMQPPWFPVQFDDVCSHIRCHEVASANDALLVIHPQAGVHQMDAVLFEQTVAESGRVPFPDGRNWEVRECLVVRMYRSNHPEQTISFRFEERSTGETFVFVTDHENEDVIPPRFRLHLEGADLLVMDCQYTREKYDRFTAGYGHATPDYVAWVAREMGVGHLGLTHHDPPASDDQVDEIVETVRGFLPGGEVFGCADYLEVEVGHPTVRHRAVASG